MVFTKKNELSVKIVLFCAMVLSCSESPDNQNMHYVYRLEYDEIINIPISEYTSYTSNNLQTFDYKKITYLAVENKHINGIQFYSLKEKKIVKELKIPEAGLGSISKIRGISVVNFDSIFVYDSFTLSNTLLLNSDGDVLNKYTIREIDSSSYFNHASMTRIPSFYFNSKLYFFKIPGNEFEQDDFFDRGVLFEYEYDLISGKTEYKHISWPNKYKNHSWGFLHTIPSRVLGHKGIFVYSFGIDPRLHVTDFRNYKKTPIAKSDYITDDIPPLKKGSQNPMQYFMEEDIYGMVLYDKYRHVYYRIAGLKSDYFDSSGKIRPADLKPYTIIILNESFEKIGETKLNPVGDFAIRDWFVGQQGLYISINSSTNKSISEDFMRFQLFKLSNQ